jgi:hypothetical protein
VASGETPFEAVDRLKERAVQLPVAGPVFLFGQVKKGEEGIPAPDGKMVGDTGLGCKLPIAEILELQLRCGPELTYSDLRKPERGKVADPWQMPFQSQWLRLDLQWRWSLPGRVGLECQTSAWPGFSPQERDQLSQDVRAVFPFGKGGQLHLGARQAWEFDGDGNLGTKSSLLYGGFRLGW